MLGKIVTPPVREHGKASVAMQTPQHDGVASKPKRRCGAKTRGHTRYLIPESNVPEGYGFSDICQNILDSHPGASIEAVRWLQLVTSMFV